MINRDTFYIIFFINDLTYYTAGGYSSPFIYDAYRTNNLKEAKQELEKLDDDCKKYAKIYKVIETKSYDFEVEE